MNRHLSIELSPFDKGVYFFSNVTASVLMGLVASRFFKSFSPAHGAIMGALSGAGVTITIINLKAAPRLSQARHATVTQLRKAPLEEVEAILLDTKELLANETLSDQDLCWLLVGMEDLKKYAPLITIKDHSAAITEVSELLHRLLSHAEPANREKFEALFKRIQNVVLIGAKNEAKQMKQVPYLAAAVLNRYNAPLQARIDLLGQKLISAHLGSFSGIALSVALPFLTHFLGWKIQSKPMTHFLVSQLAGHLFFQPIAAAALSSK